MLSAQDHAGNSASHAHSYDAKNDTPHRSGEKHGDVQTLRTASLDMNYNRMSHSHHSHHHYHQYYYNSNNNNNSSSNSSNSSNSERHPSSSRINSLAALRQDPQRTHAADAFHDTFPRRIVRRSSNDSLHSTTSTTSSIFSTASRISKLPNVVKSSLVSVKDFVIKTSSQRALHRKSRHLSNPNSHPETPHTPHTLPDRESLSTRLRRRTPSTLHLAGLFSKSSEPRVEEVAIADLSLNTSTSYSVLELKDGRATTSQQTRETKSLSKRRNSMADAASLGKESASRRVSMISEERSDPILGFSDEMARIMEQEGACLLGHEDKTSSAVGKLLFGEEIENMAFFDECGSSASSMLSFQEMEMLDTRSDHAIQSKPSLQDLVWSRQRAKSCQVTIEMEKEEREREKREKEKDSIPWTLILTRCLH
ncbi:hypothetical protein BDF14DRAFT_664170 [Spinellus fusiger]|nr:hypothetical protein BDF14DRAFT_664170 [Spinellus fusiger]